MNTLITFYSTDWSDKVETRLYSDTDFDIWRKVAISTNGVEFILHYNGQLYNIEVSQYLGYTTKDHGNGLKTHLSKDSFSLYIECPTEGKTVTVDYVHNEGDFQDEQIEILTKVQNAYMAYYEAVLIKNQEKEKQDKIDAENAEMLHLIELQNKYKHTDVKQELISRGLKKDMRKRQKGKSKPMIFKVSNK